MNATTDHDHDSPRRDKLLQRLQRLLAEQDLDGYRAQVADLAAKLGVDSIDCAAALLCMYNGGRDPGETAGKNDSRSGKAAGEIKMLRYRLEVGRRHRVSVDEIRALLVDESGVEEKMIGPVDIRGNYTLITLPEGMPADIYQHLQTVRLKQQVLRIKRLRGGKNSRRKKTGQRRGGRGAVHGGRPDAMRSAPEDKTGSSSDTP